MSSFTATYRVNDEVPGSATSRVLSVDGERNLPQVFCHVATAARGVEVAEQDVTESSHRVEQACQKTLGSMSVDSSPKW